MSTRSRRPLAALAVLVLALVGSLASVAPAWAIPALIASNPVAGSIVSSLPTDVWVEMDAPVDASASMLHLYGPSGKDFVDPGSGIWGESGRPGKVRANAYYLGDEPYGTYIFAYEVHMVDGSIISDSFSFQYGDPGAGGGGGSEPEPVVVPSLTPTSSGVTTPSPINTPVPKVTTLSSASGEMESVSIVLVAGWTALVVGVLAGIAVGIYFLVRARKRASS